MCIRDRKNFSPVRSGRDGGEGGNVRNGDFNSICRLKMIYGDDFNFSIFINETGGTTVRLEGPFQKTGCADME